MARAATLYHLSLLGAAAAACAYALALRTALAAERARRARAEENRAAERRGRIAAEQSLRKRVAGRVADEGVSMRPIGFVDSCFRDRRGTPRQGLLAPGVRARIRFESSLVQAASLEALEQ